MMSFIILIVQFFSLMFAKEFPIEGTDGLTMLYWANMDIMNPATDSSLVEKAVIVIHGAGRDVSNYYNEITQLALDEGFNVNNGDILLIALKYQTESSKKDNELYWGIDENTFGWIQGAPADNAPISSYSIIDMLFRHLFIENKHIFPNLKNAVLLGHSAGAQFVQRYALTNKLDHDANCGYIPPSCDGDLEWAVNGGAAANPGWYPDFERITGKSVSDPFSKEDMALYFFCKNVNPSNCAGITSRCERSCDGGNALLNDKIHFVTIAPTSFAYVDEKRWFEDSWRLPTNTDFAQCNNDNPGKDCTEYNSWKFGFDGLRSYDPYFASDALENSKENYIYRRVTYLCGEQDTGGFFAPFQGENRLERSKNWMKAMTQMYGDWVDPQRHSFHSIPNAGHDSWDVVPSEVTRKVVFDHY